MEEGSYSDDALLSTLPLCSRSQTVPNMATLQQESEEVRDITTPDSLLSDTRETDIKTPDSPGVSASKTPDSALSERMTNSKSPAPGYHRKQAGLMAWHSVDQESQGMEGITSAWNGMMENENEALRDRVADLEKKVHLQNDEITCLKATLADCLRRLNALEVEKDHVEICTTPTPSVQTTFQNGHSKIPLRRPLSATIERSEKTNRRISYSSDRERHNSKSSIRKSVVYQSNTSLNSDGSLSHGTPSVPTRHSSSATPRLHSSASSTAPRKITGSMGKLHKKWRSTSDFEPSPSLSVYKRSNAGSSLSFRSTYSPYGSQQNLDRHLREVSKNPQFSKEEGILRIFIKGKPISLLCPDADRVDYNIDKVNPAPSQKLKVEWVYGYRGRDARANLQLLPTGEMVYFVAAVVVLFNAEEHSQRHYLGHTEDIKCMTVHPNRLIVATGQGPGYYRREGQPHIRIWNSVSLQTLQVLGLGEFKRAISCISFSRTDGGTFIVGVDESPDHNIVVWDWQKGIKQIESKCTSETVVAVEFHPMEDGSIITCGKGHVNFWQIEPSYSAMSRKTGVLDPRDKPKYFTCLAFSSNGDLITGDSNGNVFVWGRGYNAVTKALWKIHEGPIFTICVLKDGSIITGGGKDGRVVKFDTMYRPTGQEAQLPEHLGSIRTVSQGIGSQLLLGTTKNTILNGNFDLSFQEMMIGHVEEVCALAARPAQSQFLTAGHDRMIHLWDSLSHSVVWSNDVGEQVQSACFSCDGEVIVVGTVTGKWVVLDSRTKEVYGVHQDGAEPISTVKFSPDGSKLALGSRAAIHIYKVEDGYRRYMRMGRYLAQSVFLTHLDWSEDSAHIQANNADKEVLVITAALCRVVTNSESVRNINWATSECLVSWNTLGIWGDQENSLDINTAARSNEGALLAIGDDLGHVRIYNNPATQPMCLNHSYSGHSSGVTRVAFMADDTRLLTVGGKDSAVIQWAIE